MSSMKFALMFFLAVPGCALATQSASTGIISFSGAVTVEGDPEQQADAQNYRDDQVTAAPVSLRIEEMPTDNTAYTDVNWLDSERRHGVLTVNYK
ncbi:hypothetical protein [Erwinia sp. CGal63]|uniref:hypothetical protein n=1 Tax=Erwinia sp. CGal63 TaxID=2919889 RepID=UPI00300A82CE